MKFTAITQDAKGEMRETMSHRSVLNMQQAQEHAMNILARFNATLRPGESRRVLARIEDMALDDKPPHEWEKASLVTEKDKTGCFDRMRCVHCGLEGRRYGIGPHVRPWPQWSRKKSRYIEHCEPEKGLPPVDIKENEVTISIAKPEDVGITAWYHTATDGNPVHKGLYQTTADPERTSKSPLLWRYSDGALRWGPSDKDPQRALERATTEKMLLTAPLYWRGLMEPGTPIGNAIATALESAAGVNAPASEVPAPRTRERVPLDVSVQEEQLPLFVPRPRVRLVLADATTTTDQVRQRVPLVA